MSLGNILLQQAFLWDNMKTKQKKNVQQNEANASSTKSGRQRTSNISTFQFSLL